LSPASTTGLITSFYPRLYTMRRIAMTSIPLLNTRWRFRTVRIINSFLLVVSSTSFFLISANPNNPGEFTKKSEVYKTKGLSKVSATSAPMKLERPSSIKQSSDGSNKEGKSGVSSLSSVFMEMRLHSARKGGSVKVESYTQS
jgi:hypothetical protein